MSLEAANEESQKRAGHFETTNWTVIFQAARTHSPEKLHALEKLCRSHWYPVYAFVRRKGYSQQDAEDLTQGFFAHFLSKDSLKKADQAKGKFRNFLLASVINFLTNEWDKRETQKRGGAKKTITFTDCSPEELYRQEPVDQMTPERLFERRWAFVLIERVMKKLRAEYENGGKVQLFECLRPFLTTEAKAAALVEPAARLKMEEGTMKVSVHRMRRRFGELLRAEISQTVSSIEEVDAEIRNLMTVVAQ